MKTLALVLSLFATTAVAAPINYTFVFSSAVSAVAFDPEEPGGSGAPFLASTYDEPRFNPLFQVDFAHDGPVNGTIQLADMAVESLSADYWNSAVGWLTFDDSQVVAWDAYNDATLADHSWGYAYHHHSEPATIEDWMILVTVNPEDVATTTHFGVTYTEPSSFHFQMKPGRWSCFVQGVSCGAVVSAPPAPTHAPIPASLGLLLGGLAGLAWVGRRRP